MVITPIVLIFALSGIVDGALEKIADPEGCCLSDSTALDSLIPPLLNDLIIANIPIIGDVLGFFYPYVCSQRYTGRLTYKTKLILPKFIEYAHLTSFFFNWPDYNCRINGQSAIYGKKLEMTATPYYEWSLATPRQHTDLNRLCV